MTLQLSSAGQLLMVQFQLLCLFLFLLLPDLQPLSALPVTTQPAPPSQPLASGTASASLPTASLAAKSAKPVPTIATKPAKPVPTRTASATFPLPPFTPQPASATQP